MAYVPNYDDSNTFVDYYFVVYQAQYPLIHEATFRAQWNDIVPKPALRE
jgi:transcriptional regulatory protein GAL4